MASACNVDTQVCGKLRSIKYLPPPEVAVSTNLEVLEAEVLQLSPTDRSRLFERLIASIDSDNEVEQAWEVEGDRRESELESGLVVAVPGQQAIARLRARLA
jgi:putative addiction module component (TIGR02574 family)